MLICITQYDVCSKNEEKLLVRDVTKQENTEEALFALWFLH